MRSSSNIPLVEPGFSTSSNSLILCTAEPPVNDTSLATADGEQQKLQIIFLYSKEAQEYCNAYRDLPRVYNASVLIHNFGELLPLPSICIPKK